MSEHHTPVDRPLRISDINDLRKAVHDISQRTVEMYDATMQTARTVEASRTQFRSYVALCAACTFFSVVAAVISVVASVTQASPLVLP